MDTYAADYIATMANQSDYEESPYFKLNRRSKQSTNSNKQNQDIKESVIDVGKDTADTFTPHNQGMSDYETPHPDLIKSFTRAMQRKRSLEIYRYEKQHNFANHTFRGAHWCDFCGNFLWGLIVQGVRCQDCGFNAHKKCSEKIPNDCLPNTKYVQRMFGVDLTTIVKAHNRPRPIVVDMCIKEIEQRGLDNEGLYRLCGFTSEVEAIRQAFDTVGEHTDISKDAYEDIHSICSVLKLFLRLLPIPVISFDTYDKFIGAAKTLDEAECIHSLQDCLSQLPPAHYQTLKYLTQHFYNVSKHSEKNKMTAKNLATCMWPTLIRSPDSNPLTSLQNSQSGHKVIEILISHQASVFRK